MLLLLVKEEISCVFAHATGSPAGPVFNSGFGYNREAAVVNFETRNVTPECRPLTRPAQRISRCHEVSHRGSLDSGTRFPETNGSDMQSPTRSHRLAFPAQIHQMTVVSPSQAYEEGDNVDDSSTLSSSGQKAATAATVVVISCVQ